MPRQCRRAPLAQTRTPTLHSSPYALTRLGPHQPDDQVQPVHLTPGVLVVELRPRPDVLQAAVLVGVEQAVEVEARCPLVLGLKDRLGVLQADPPYVLGELTVGSCQILRCGAQLTVRRVDLLDQRIVIYRRLLSSTLACSPSPCGRSPLALVPCAPEHCPCLSFSLTSAGTPSRLARLLSGALPAPLHSPRRCSPPKALPSLPPVRSADTV